MVQINLPKNSEVTKGKYYQDKTGSKNIRKVNVYRSDSITALELRGEAYYFLAEHDMGRSCDCVRVRAVV